MSRSWLFGTALVVLASACQDAPTASPDRPPLAVSARGQGGCAADPNFVVSDEAGLLAALATAPPGSVIAIEGMISVFSDVIITTSDLTLTCATPGAGLRPIPDNPGLIASALLTAAAPRLTVDHLVLEARDAPTVFYAPGSDGVRFTNNTVYCGHPDFSFLQPVCVFYSGGLLGIVIEGNYIEASGAPSSGIHVQGDFIPGHRIAAPRIQGNVMVGVSLTSGPGFGAIRVRDADDATIVRNRISQWHNGISISALGRGSIAYNEVVDPTFYGIVATGFDPTATVGNAFVGNRVTNAGQVGIRFGAGCTNSFIGNNVQANSFGLVLDVRTGNNTVRGNPGVVVDIGAVDCDGDGVIDPNIIGGQSVVVGADFGPVVSPVVRRPNGTVVQ